MFERHGVTVNPESELARLMVAAEALADRDLTRPIESQAEFDQMLQAAHFDRLSDAILLLDDQLAPAHHLRRLTAHSLDFMNVRAPSPAKDAFWEFELWEKIKRRHANTTLAEPDIVVATDAGELPVACKKIYALKAAETRLRKGMHQLARFNGVGVVAINIDDLVTRSQVLRHTTADALGAAMENVTLEFFNRNGAQLQQYFERGRVSAAAVSLTLFAEFTEDSPRFNYMHQLTVLVSRHAQSSVRARLDILASSMGARIEGI